ncbi:hypothetical protein ABT174_40645 [Streptomyces sparsogenes]|uniref:hypothetical protein n=1 Tax=Streptomyces sparsogenes TaxID=67365 RepID=UPI0033208172
MSQVKMTGDFASTMVTVVPVTLLIAVVEVSRYYALFAQASVKEMEELRAAAQAALEQPIQMRMIFLFRWERSSAADTFRIMYWSYAVIMAAVIIPLVFVEVWLVRWLARAEPHDSPALAAATWGCTVWSFVMVGFLAPWAHFHMEKALAMWLKAPLEYEVKQYMRMVQDKLSASGEQTYGEFLDQQEEIKRRALSDLEQRLRAPSAGGNQPRQPEA